MAADYRVDGKSVTATLVDYLKDGQPQKFVRRDYPEDAQPADFHGYPGYRRTSSGGYAHLDVIIGRWGLLPSCGPDLASQADKIAEAIIKAIKGKKLVARAP